MSSDVRIPDADVLAKAPTAYRSEIARVLQLKKLESKQSRSIKLEFSSLFST